MAYRYDETGQPYEYEVSRDVTKLVIGLLVGAVIGATVMLFVAPDSGKKTIARLRKKSRHLRDNTREAVDGTVKEARHRFDKATAGVRQQARVLTTRGHDLLDEQRERVAEAVDSGRKRIRVPGR